MLQVAGLNFHLINSNFMCQGLTKMLIICCRDAKGITYTLCHSAVCVLVLAVLLTVGYFVPTRELPKDNSTFHNLLEDLQTNRKDFIHSLLSLIDERLSFGL